MLEIFTTIRKINKQYWLWDQHIARLRLLLENLDIEHVKRALSRVEGDCIIRLSVAPEIRISTRPFKQLNCYAENPIAMQSTRLMSSDHKLAQDLSQEVLFTDSSGLALELNRYNLFGLKNGVWHTPSSDLPLYNGTMRRELLHFFKRHQIKFKESGPLDLKSCQAVVVTNAIQGALPVDQINGHAYRGNNIWLDQFKKYLETQWSSI